MACVVRKSQTAIALAQKKLRRYASRHGTQLQPETLVYAQYVMVLTTFPAPDFSLQQVLDHYRFRWQIELVFKRFKLDKKTEVMPLRRLLKVELAQNRL